MDQLDAVKLSPLHSFMTRFTLQTAVRLFKIISFLKLVPFECTSKDSLGFRKLRSGWKLMSWHLINWIFFFAQIFQILSFTHTLMGGVRGNAFAVHTVCLVCSLFGSAFVLSVYMKSNECILLLRQHERLLQKVSGKVKASNRLIVAAWKSRCKITMETI